MDHIDLYHTSVYFLIIGHCLRLEAAAAEPRWTSWTLSNETG